MHIFTIYDTIAERAGNLFMTNTMAEAERQFKDAIIHAQDGSLFKTHPESFELYKIGKFDPSIPTIQDPDTQLIMKGKDALSDIVSDTVNQADGN